MTSNQTSLPTLNSLSLLKLMAVFGILAGHTSLITNFDICARMVEILFLASGFLMAYNHHQEEATPTPWQIVKKKLPRFYPIHLLCFLMQWLFVATWTIKPLSFLLTVGILNLTLQQAWFVKTEFSYNNVSWFLSALVFAYASTPTIKSIIKSAETKKAGLLSVFLGFAALRFYCEYFAEHAIRYVAVDPHCNPFVQMLNYALGYITAVAFIQKNTLNTILQKDISAKQLSILQILIILLYIQCCCYLSINSRACFVLLALPLFYILAVDRGIIKAISLIKPIQWLNAMTLEIFMFHSFILYKIPTDKEHPMSYVIFLIVTIVVSFIYHLLYQQIIKRIKA